MKKFYSKEEVEYLKLNVNIKDVMHHFGFVEDEYNRFICPNPEHNDHHPSAKYVKVGGKDNKIKNCLVCFSCNTDRANVIDNIQAYAWLSGLDKQDDFIKILNGLEEIEQTDEIKPVKAESKEKTKDNTNKKQKQDDFDYHINISDSMHQMHIEKKDRCYVLDEYFNKRCINHLVVKNLLEKNNCEFRHNFFNGINTIYFVDYNKRVIFQRQMEDYLQGRENAPHQKFITGATTFTYLKNDNAKVLMIFEGIYDTLSYITYGLSIKDQKDCSYISLNSTKNIVAHKEELEKIFDEYDMIITLCDNDAEGKKANDKLKEMCGDKLLYITPLYNDWNEQIIKEKEKERKQRKRNKYNGI